MREDGKGYLWGIGAIGGDGEMCMVESKLSFVLIITLLLINFFPKTNRMEINSYDSERRDERNPLYKKRERFRKSRDHKRGS